LVYARHIGKERAAAEAAEARAVEMTAAEVRAAAAAEGFELVPSSSKDSGFKGVTRREKGSMYRANIKENGKDLYLGSSKTPEGAALVYARHIGKERAAAEAAEARANHRSPSSTTRTSHVSKGTNITHRYERKHKKPTKYEDYK
jgi:hypothetical protein